MAAATAPFRLPAWRPGPAAQLCMGLSLALAIALVAVGPQRLTAQIEGDRGIPPIASTADILISGVQVNVTGKNAQ